jgi:hypothetical protein
VYDTVKVTRKDIPPSVKTKKLKKGEAVAFQRGKAMALRWRDKKDVVLLSTILTN